MAAKTYTLTRVDGSRVRMTRGRQGRLPSPDPKERVPLRLYRSWRARIAASGMTEQRFIERAVSAAIFGTQELLNH